MLPRIADGFGRVTGGFVFIFVLAVTTLLHGQALSSRPNPADPAYPFNTPSLVSTPVSSAQLEEWRKQIKAALYISDPLPALDSKSYGSFSPTPDVIAERVTYGTNFGMRVPAIVYRPAHASGKLPGMVIVDGHGGDKTTYYSFYAGILYAKAGAVVVTYDSIGADERNRDRLSEGKTHDTVVDEPHAPARMGGLMITDVMQAVSYLTSRRDVDSGRIAVAGYSMGSFVSALAAGVDPRIRVLILSGGGDLDGNMGSWDHSSKIMCQAGPYQALSFLPDKGAILYALHQRSGPTLILNGRLDALVGAPHHFEPFFADLNERIAAISGTRVNLPESRFIEGVGHRPSWITRPAAVWLQEQLRFPNWTVTSIGSMGESHISEWTKRTGAHVIPGFTSEEREGGIMALRTDIPNVPRDELQAVPDGVWQRDKEQYIWEAWVHHVLAADGVDSTTATDPTLQP